jgi:hypothetical protein
MIAKQKHGESKNVVVRRAGGGSLNGTKSAATASPASTQNSAGTDASCAGARTAAATVKTAPETTTPKNVADAASRRQR